MNTISTQPFSLPCRLIRAGLQLLSLPLLFLPLLALSQSQGPLNPASFANNNTTCPFAYTSVAHIAPGGNVATSNNVYASATHCDCCDTQTSCLEARNYGFTIPATAIIDGIRVDVERRRSVGAGGYIEDNGVMILKGGVYSGPNKANYGVNWPTSDAYVSYGGTTDLWGTAWTPADINAAGFGVAIASISYTCGSAMTSFVDHIRITVFYTDILPVICSPLAAVSTPEGVELSWRMEDPSSLSHLWIESASAEGEFSHLADVDVYSSQFTDRFPPTGRTWYRLGWRDNDGNEGWSNVAEVLVAPASPFTVTVVGSELEVRFSQPLVVGSQLMMMDAGGRGVFSSRVPEGVLVFRSAMPAFAGGIYWVGIPGLGMEKIVMSGGF